MPVIPEACAVPWDDLSGPSLEMPIHMDISRDTRRLQAQHSNTGYREGITMGKSTTIQEGFDQGYVLGASIGMKAGQVVGLLQAISAALVKKDDSGGADEAACAADLLSMAVKDLAPERLFTSEFWASDGSWTYKVTPSQGTGAITCEDVASQHPLIAKWSHVATKEAENRHINYSMPILNSVEDCTPERTRQGTLLKQDKHSRAAVEW
ncbi:hypothetical protein F5Y17DRAFT_430620 [Xylariaceae sp. FL0594]|nr:hypothetical protein F5Y17DRAFT_430620 [Xylariaceae sp. FL0594]